MYQGKKILAVVPARGGSKGVPLKNIHPLGGKPLITWVKPVIDEVSEIDRTVVSTDSEKIAEVAKSVGLDVPFYRPETLSGDRIGDLEVLTHSLLEMEEQDKCTYDIVLMLQPTCPLRKAKHVTDTFVKLVDEDRDAVWTLSETDSKGHPLKQFNISEKGDLAYYDEEGKKIIARQQLVPVYHRNGSSYAITRECLLDQKSIFGNNPAAVITESLISIDTLEDFEMTEWMLERNQLK